MRINLNKIELILAERMENIKVFAFELQCKVGMLPRTCLGYLIHNSLGWVEERFCKRLFILERQYIS